MYFNITLSVNITDISLVLNQFKMLINLKKFVLLAFTLTGGIINLIMTGIILLGFS